MAAILYRRQCVQDYYAEYALLCFVVDMYQGPVESIFMLYRDREMLELLYVISKLVREYLFVWFDIDTHSQHLNS